MKSEKGLSKRRKRGNDKVYTCDNLGPRKKDGGSSPGQTKEGVPWSGPFLLDKEVTRGILFSLQTDLFTG